jgi:hypothetical protein
VLAVRGRPAFNTLPVPQPDHHALPGILSGDEPTTGETQPARPLGLSRAAVALLGRGALFVPVPNSEPGGGLIRLSLCCLSHGCRSVVVSCIMGASKVVSTQGVSVFSLREVAHRSGSRPLRGVIGRARSPPRLESLNLAYGLWRDTVSRGQADAHLLRCAYFLNLLSGEPCAPMFLTTSLTALIVPVRYVVVVSAEAKMSRIHARRIVAGVQHANTTRQHHAMCEFVCGTMRSGLATV